MTGGYKIIDLYGLDLANMQLDSTKIEKIFSDIESTYKTKALLFDNYKINGIEQNATFSSAVVKNSGFEITLGDYKILIKTDSVVDSTPHLYRHDIGISIKQENVYEGKLFLSLYNTNNNKITNKEELLNNYSDLDISVTGCINNQGIYVIYGLGMDENNNYIYYNDDEYSFEIIQFNDIVTKIF